MIRFPMNREVFEQKKKELKAKYGIVIDKDTGSVTFMDVFAAYQYDGKELIITVVRKPFYLTQSFILNELKERFQE